MIPDRSFVVQFPKLSDGLNEFEFHIDNSFFGRFEFSKIKEAEAIVHLLFDKGDLTHNLNFSLEGKVKLDCDRCTEAIFIPVKDKTTLVIKQVDEPAESDHEVMFVSKHDYEINLSQYIYDFIHTAVPMRVTCEIEGAEKKCDDAALQKIEEMTRPDVHEADVDERWSKLKDIKLN